MSSSYVVNSASDFFPQQDENIMDSLFKQYERVVVESLITSFGLDFLVKDQYGGDVDTVHNVRQIGKDGQMYYKSKENQKAYENRGDYNSHEYHSHKGYIEKNRGIKVQKEQGELKDAYTGEQILQNDKTDLDHVISAKEVHDDAGRILAGLNGADLANSPENLQATNQRTNRTKKADTMDTFLGKYGDEYSEEQKRKMRKHDAQSRKEYEVKIAKAYYSSPKFAKDVAIAAGNVGMSMGARQALGFVFAEVWFAVKEEFQKIRGSFDLGEFFCSIGKGIRTGFENAKANYKTIFEKFKEGAVAGILSSITTTLCNIFFTTAKNIVRIIRQSYASIVEACKVLFLNPESLQFGDRIRAVSKILATGASVVVGTIVSESLAKTPIATIPVLGDVVQTFCGVFVTGIMSCTLLYVIDRNEIINKLVAFLNNIHTIETEVAYYREQALYFERYAAELLEIDIEKFRKETHLFNSFVSEIENAKNEEDLNGKLMQIIETIGVKLPWDGDFDEFMSNRNSTMVFA